MEVLSKLFFQGTNDLLSSFSNVFQNTLLPHVYSSPSLGQSQDHSLASFAPKIQHDEGNIDFHLMTATHIHNL